MGALCIHEVRCNRDNAETEGAGGKPASVIGTGANQKDPGLLRIDFPSYSGEGTLQEISWDEW